MSLRVGLSKKLILLILFLSLTSASLNAFGIVNHSYLVSAQSGRTWHVDDDLQDYPKADFTKIGEAVNAASSGDTIIAYPGTYTENLDVTKGQLTITSKDGADSTTIQALNSGDHVFEIKAANVNVSGFTIRGATGNDKAGIYSYDSSFSVSDSSLSDNNYGIYIYSTPRSPLRVSGSIFRRNNHGIHSQSSYGSRYGEVNVSDSTFSHNNYGIYTSDFCGVSISNSTFSNNDYGIYGRNRVSIHAERSSFSSNSYGIYGDSIWGINSIHSSFDDNDHGVYAINGWDNTLSISYSNFQNNRGAIYYRASTLSSHRVFLNNFVNNTSEVDSSTSEYVWNSLEQMTYTYNGKSYTNYLGNYWSRYKGTDTDRDGIGDSPYSVNGDRDDYPLMGLWVDGSIKAVNQPPDQPINTSPANGATQIRLAPRLRSSPFSDQDIGDLHAASQWQITTTPSDYSNPVFDSGRDTENLESIAVPEAYNLSHNTTYYWHVRYQDNHSAWSGWSREASFITASKTSDYELFVEIDYMPGHRPTDSVLEYIKAYYSQRSISLTFIVDEEVPLDEKVTHKEFWDYEERYNNRGDDWVKIRFEGDMGVVMQGEFKTTSKWKWVLYGTVDEEGANGYTYSGCRDDAGNYIFIADETNDKEASDLLWKILYFGQFTAENKEAVTLMHELGHAIGVTKLARLNGKCEEITDEDTSSVMSYSYDYTNILYRPIGYSREYWNLKDLEFYSP